MVVQRSKQEMVPTRNLSIEFSEILAKTFFSFLEGSSSPEEMIEQGKTLGYQSLGIIDRNGVYGLPRAHGAAKALNFNFLCGAEIEIENHPAWLIAKNRSGYGDLCELLTLVHAHHGNPTSISYPTLFEKSQNLFLILPALSSIEKEIPEAQNVFKDRFFLAAFYFLDGTDSRKTALEFEKKFKVPIIATNLPLFHSVARKPLQDVLSCIRHTCTLEEGGFRLLANEERYLKPISELVEIFPTRWLTNTVRISKSCDFSLDELRYQYPTEWIPSGETAWSYLRALIEKGVVSRYLNPSSEVKYQVERELALIQELKYEDYFLTVWDIVQFARSRGILCQGRGSAANSIVCYVLGITSVDPIRMELLFERFISRERNEPPDIDIDFEHERREEVIQYLYDRYGRDRAAITAEVICYRRKSAMREVAKVFSIPVVSVEKLQTLTHRRSLSEVTLDEIYALDPQIPSQRWNLYWERVLEIRGFPRHLGTHVGGFVLCQDKLTRFVPVESAAMEARTIIQWDKNDLDTLGFVKVDVLGLGILTAIRKCFSMISEIYSKNYSLASIPAEDPKVYEKMREADTVGAFQIESRAQMNMLPRLKPRNFFDLVVEISLVRPGPIQGDMVHPYLRRRAGKEKVEYPHPDLKSILHKTYGVPIFQEQIMKIAMQVAGFTAGEADELRRAMGTWRSHGTNRLSQLGEKFKEGLIKHGVPTEFAERIFSQIEGFAEYGFPESHAASFALIAYASMFLKHYYPDAYLAALLNAQPMGFYSAHTLIHDGERHGVSIKPIDINDSTWDNRLLEKKVIRLGFRQVRGLAHNKVLTLEKERKGRPFQNLDDCVSRLKTTFNRRDFFLLASVHAFSAFGFSRRQALWEIQALELRHSIHFSPPEPHTDLPKEKNWEAHVLDYESQGVTLNSHPIACLREEGLLNSLLSSKDLKFLKTGTRTRTAGLVISRQMPPTASGVLFITLEDEFGFTNLVIWNPIFQKYREFLLAQSFLWCEGKIERPEDANITHFIVESVRPLL